MSIRSKNDIPYVKFKEFTESIAGQEHDEWFVAIETLRVFYPKKKSNYDKWISEFAKSLVSEVPARMNYKLDLTFKTAGKFIDCENFTKDDEVIEFLKLVLKPKYFWQRINWNKISLADVEYCLTLFQKFQARLKVDTLTSTTHPYTQTVVR